MTQQSSGLSLYINADGVVKGSNVSKRELRKIAKEAKKTQNDLRILDGGMDKLGGGMVTASGQVKKASTDINDLGKKSKRATKEVAQLNRANDNVAKGLKYLRRTLGSIGALYVARKVQQYSDAWIEATNRIRLFTESATAAQFVQEELFNISQRSRAEFGALASLYNKMALAQKQLGASTKNILVAVEAVAQATRISGSNAISARGALLQLGQALTTGRVFAEEINSIIEGIPALAVAMAESIDEAEGSIGKLKLLVKSGDVGSTQLFEAILLAADDLEEKFKLIVPTIADSWTVLDNALTRYVGSLNKGTGIMSIFATLLRVVGHNIDFIADSIGFSLVVLGLYFGYMRVRRITEFIASLNILNSAFVNQTRAATGATGAMLIFKVAVAEATLAINALTLAMARNPYTAAFVAITLLVTAMYTFGDSITFVKGSVATLRDYMVVAFRAVWGIIKDGATIISKSLEGIFSVASDHARPYFNIISVAASHTNQAIRRQINGLAGLYVHVGNVMSNMLLGTDVDLERSYKAITNTDFIEAWGDGVWNIFKRWHKAAEDLHKQIKGIINEPISPYQRTTLSLGIDTPPQQLVKSLQDKLDSVQSATPALSFYNDSFEQYKKAIDKFNRDKIKLTPFRNNQIRDLFADLAASKQAQDAISRVRTEQEQYNDSLTLYNELRNRGVLLESQYQKAVEASAVTLLRSHGFKPDEVKGGYDKFREAVVALNNAYVTGGIDVVKYRALQKQLHDDLGRFVVSVRTDAQVAIEGYHKSLAELNKFLDGNDISDTEYMQGIKNLGKDLTSALGIDLSQTVASGIETANTQLANLKTLLSNNIISPEQYKQVASSIAGDFLNSYGFDFEGITKGYDKWKRSVDALTAAYDAKIIGLVEYRALMKQLYDDMESFSVSLRSEAQVAVAEYHEKLASLNQFLEANAISDTEYMQGLKNLGDELADALGVDLTGTLSSTIKEAQTSIANLNILLSNNIITLEDYREHIDNIGETFLAAFGINLKNTEAIIEKHMNSVEAVTMGYKAGIISIEDYTQAIKDLKTQLADEFGFKFLSDSQQQAIDLNKQLEQLNLLLAEGIISTQEYGYALLNIYSQFDLIAGDIKSLQAHLLKAVENWSDGFTDAIVKAVETGKLSFSDLARSVISDLIRMTVQASITAPLLEAIRGGVASSIGGSGFLSGFLGAPAPGATGSAGAGFNGLADANVGFRASGGPVSANSPYVVGERGPELFIPNASGTVVANRGGGGGSSMAPPVINVNIENYASDVASASDNPQLSSNSDGTFDLNIMIDRLDKGLAEKANKGQSRLAESLTNRYNMPRNTPYKGQ